MSPQEPHGSRRGVVMLVAALGTTAACFGGSRQPPPGPAPPADAPGTVAGAGRLDAGACCSKLLPDLDETARMALESATQMLVVVVPTWDDASASVGLFRRFGGGWARQLGPYDAVVGSRGMAWGRGLTAPPRNATRVKVEGDETTPAGVFRPGIVMGRTPRGPDGLRVPYRRATADTVCVDDPASVHYNSIVEASSTARDWSSWEPMLRNDGQYDLLLVIGHNGARGDITPLAGAGSCIFLHLLGASTQPTIGCTALDGTALRDVLIALESLDRTLLVQLPAAEYAQAIVDWRLPEPGP